MTTNERGLQRYNTTHIEPVTDPYAEHLRRAIADITTRTGQPPVVIHMPPEPATSRSQLDVTQIVIAALVAVAVIVVSSLLIVACHETPQVQQTVNKPHCTAVC